MNAWNICIFWIFEEFLHKPEKNDQISFFGIRIRDVFSDPYSYPEGKKNLGSETLVITSSASLLSFNFVSKIEERFVPIKKIDLFSIWRAAIIKKNKVPI